MKNFLASCTDGMLPVLLPRPRLQHKDSNKNNVITSLLSINIIIGNITSERY